MVMRCSPGSFAAVAAVANWPCVIRARRTVSRAIAVTEEVSIGAMAVLFSTTAFAQGTAAEAKAMLDRAVAAVKADKTKALDMFNKGEGGFLDRDLYPFC